MTQRIELNFNEVGPSGPNADLEDLWRVFVFPADDLGRGTLRYELPSLYRTRDFSVRTHLRTIRAGGVCVTVWVVVVRRK